jgi:hypothetical protein
MQDMKEDKGINKNLFWLYIFFVYIVCLNIGCTGHAENKQENNQTTDDRMSILSQAKLAPGTIKVEASVIKMKKINNHFTCIIKVEKVLGYGMATKPVPKGSEINLNLTNSREELIKLLSEGTMQQKYELTIEQERMADNQLQWRALQIKKIHFEQ